MCLFELSTQAICPFRRHEGSSSVEFGHDILSTCLHTSASADQYLSYSRCLGKNTFGKHHIMSELSPGCLSCHQLLHSTLLLCESRGRPVYDEYEYIDDCSTLHMHAHSTRYMAVCTTFIVQSSRETSGRVLIQCNHAGRLAGILAATIHMYTYICISFVYMFTLSLHRHSCIASHTHANAHAHAQRCGHRVHTCTHTCMNVCVRTCVHT
jgi:hypothetical protein